MTNPLLAMFMSEDELDGRAVLFDYLATTLIERLGENIDEFQWEDNTTVFSGFLKDYQNVEQVNNHITGDKSIFKEVKRDLKKKNKFDILDEVEKFLGEDNEDD